MFALLARLLIKNSADTGNMEVRRSYGMLSGILGIALNIVLFAGKLFAGTVSGSVAITADAFNNLSDAGSSLITLFGFKYAGKRADAEHPFGHGRIEYVSAMLVAVLIMFMGFELLKTSVRKIIDPQPVDASLLPMLILVASIIVKLYMYFYNRRYGKLLDSQSMRATATDSISDAVSTTVVLAAAILMRFTGIKIDGWCGLLVALFILRAGFLTVKETVGTLLGSPPSKEMVDRIEEIVCSHDCVLGMHDLVVHDYGPGRLIISLHAEVPCNGDLLEMHDAIDHIENDLANELGCEAVIHMDPIQSDDEAVSGTRASVAELVASIDSRMTIHDFRMVPGPTHTNIIFDVVKPFDLPMSDEELSAEIQRLVSGRWKDYYCVMKIDNPYT
ncbi:MAG: cation transporter [Oscillospiraceae bacterium]|nr:cation transporter [Oscillospiraceae bacterium]